MNPGGETHQRDWNEQRETISAYVDGALPQGERAHFEQHLASCPICQHELEAMRQVSALLRRMPQPALPRSFALPAAPDTLAPAPKPAPAARTPADSARVVPFVQRAGRIAQRVGTLAAAVGVVLLLGSAVLGHSHTLSYGGATSASNSAAEAPRATAVAGQPGSGYSSAQPTPREGTSGPQSNESKPAASSTPTTSVPPSPTPTNAATARVPSSTTGSGSAAPAEGPPLVPLTGAGLLVGGAAVAVSGRIISRRGRNRRHDRR